MLTRESGPARLNSPRFAVGCGALASRTSRENLRPQSATSLALEHFDFPIGLSNGPLADDRYGCLLLNRQKQTTTRVTQFGAASHSPGAALYSQVHRRGEKGLRRSRQVLASCWVLEHYCTGTPLALRLRTVNIRFTSSLTDHDENLIAPALLKAVASVLDLLPIAYVIRIDTSDDQLYQHARSVSDVGTLADHREQRGALNELPR